MSAVTSCHSTNHGHRIKGAPVIAMIGAPNAGKSTLFNGLTGARAHMGNWPGTTVEVSRGAWRVGDVTYDVIDFPGAYSLDPVSPDEKLTRDLVIDTAERPDAVMVVVDAASLSRGLYLVSQLAEEEFRILVVITKSDVAEKQGFSLDCDVLSEQLGVPVVQVDPRRRAKIAEVGQALTQLMDEQPRRRRHAISDDEFELADERFAWVESAVSAATTQRESVRTLTERIDVVALHPVLGPLMFLAAMWLVFQITTTVAAPFQDALDAFFAGPVSDAARSILEPFPPLVTGLIVDGLIGGVGMVLTFAPLMALMFLCIAVLEDSGYMARAAVVTDKLMKAIGLPGKAFIPLIVGFGCNVPAISATRVLAEPRQRLLTSLLIPFTSCSARLTVYVMLAATFFPDNAGTAVFVMYLISIGLVVLTGLCLRHTLWRHMGEESLVIDLPTYQIPGARLALSVMWVRLKGFLHTAGGIIVATVVVVFVLQSTPTTSGYSFGDENLPPQESAYGVMSQTVAPVFEPAGFGSWSIAGTLVTGFVAKEAVISSWAQTYSLDDVTDADPEEQGKSALASAIRKDFDAASGGHPIAAVWAFMVFLLAYTPCVATLAAQRREIGLKWTLYGIGLQLTAAWVLSVVVFQVLKVWW
ncbi:MAG: ferrous iron transport protein B [Corynebacterium sp.]|nr:ferrous iron transport protein B [Corynebacterium sp.]